MMLELEGDVFIDDDQEVFIGGDHLTFEVAKVFTNDEFVRVAINGVDVTGGQLMWDEDDAGAFPAIHPEGHSSYCLCSVFQDYEGEPITLVIRESIPD